MRLVVFLAFLVLPLPLMAAEQLEIIELRYRLVEDVIPVLQPLLAPDGVMTGMGNQLIVRTSAGNLHDIRRALAVVDRPPRRLAIQVSQERRRHGQEHSLGLSARDGSTMTITDGRNTAASAEAKIGSDRSGLAIRGDAALEHRHGRTLQSMQVLDGSPALIHIGRSLAVPMRRITVSANRIQVSETVQYVDIGQGFYATPRLNGNQMTVEITPYSEEESSRGGGHVDTRRLSTTVSGQLGQWIELGAGSSQSTKSQTRILGTGSAASSDQQSIWLRVDEIP